MQSKHFPPPPYGHPPFPITRSVDITNRNAVVYHPPQAVYHQFHRNCISLPVPLTPPRGISRTRRVPYHEFRRNSISRPKGYITNASRSISRRQPPPSSPVNFAFCIFNFAFVSSAVSSSSGGATRQREGSRRTVIIPTARVCGGRGDPSPTVINQSSSVPFTRRRRISLAAGKYRAA